MGFLTGISDHGLLSGLADDDHTQYVLRNILTTDGDLFARDTGAVTRIAAVATGQVLASAGTGTLPVWSASPTLTGLTLTAGTLAAGAKAHILTATQPTTPTARQEVINWTVSGAGSAEFSNFILFMRYNAGYTGSDQCAAIRVENFNATSGTLSPFNNVIQSGTNAIATYVNAAAADVRGVVCDARGGTTRSIGFLGTVDSPTAGSLGYGVMGAGYGTGKNYGGYFFLNSAGAAGTCALAADNQSYARDIFQAMDAGSVVFVIADTGLVGIGASSPVISGTGKLHMTADTFRLDTARTPATAGAAGNAGDICWDASFIYVCTATNAWERVAIASW